MADISKRLEKAEKHLQKGRQDSALEEYLEALREDPHNEMVCQTAADLSLSLGRSSDAARLLAPLFDQHVASGDASKAVAIYRKLLRAGKPSVEQTFRFGQLVERSNRREALDAYQAAVQGFLAAGRKHEALAVLKRVLLLDSSQDNFRREGELAAEVGDRVTAAIAFLKGGELQEQSGITPLPWYERAYNMDPSNPEVALVYARSLVDVQEFEAAIDALAPFAAAEDASVEQREVYASALMAAGRLPEAEPFIWELFERDPAGQINTVAGLIGALVEAGHQEHALELAHKLEVQQLKIGRQREFVALLKDIGDKRNLGVDFLEYLVEVYNASNREHDYCECLLKLFELYYGAQNYLKAADCLDRAAEVDAYEPGHRRRLEMLQGKIDPAQFNAIASRFTTVTKEEEKQDDLSAEGESTVLEDLMLQAEIFLQYSMRTKAVERLERIRKLFPREEERSEKLRELYNAAGMIVDIPITPAATAPIPVPSTKEQPAAKPAMPASSASVPTAVANENAVDNFARVTEITRNIYRQGSVKGVLFTAVNEIGRHFNASRCVSGLCTPGKPPAAAMEYCAPGIKQSEIMALVKLIMTCQSLAVMQGTLSMVNVPGTPELESIRSFVQSLEIESLLAVPLMDGDEHAGILILEQCGKARNWRPTDEVVLKTIAEQMVLAVNNARLRSLVKTLAVTEEKSGLLKRSSYLDVLLSEVRRAMQQSSTCTVMLMHFGKTSALVREYGEATVESIMQQVGQVITGHIRQNDVAVRYELMTIALLLADTAEKNAFFVVDKLRKALSGIHLPGKTTPLPMTVGIAEAVMQARFDPVDIVTEVINRVERALEAAKSEGSNTVKSQSAELESAAVTA